MLNDSSGITTITAVVGGLLTKFSLQTWRAFRECIMGHSMIHGVAQARGHIQRGPAPVPALAQGQNMDAACYKAASASRARAKQLVIIR